MDWPSRLDYYLVNYKKAFRCDLEAKNDTPCEAIQVFGTIGVGKVDLGHIIKIDDQSSCLQTRLVRGQSTKY